VAGVPLKTHVSVQEDNERWAGKFFEGHHLTAVRVIAVHPGASCPTKKWPAKRFAEVINALAARDKAAFLLVGGAGADDRATADSVLAAVHNPVLDMTGRTSVGQLASLLKRCHLLISNDSGPVHIADGLGVPVISIFTRNQPGINPERWRPLGEQAQTVVTPFEGKKSFCKSNVPDPEYLDLIPVQAVLQAVDAVFKLC